jgi:hypothetical protein
MIGACKRAWRYYCVALALSWTVSYAFPNGQKCPFGCNGYVTAVTVGQSQRLYSGVGIFNWYYLSSPPQVLRVFRCPLE